MCEARRFGLLLVQSRFHLASAASKIAVCSSEVDGDGTREASVAVLASMLRRKTAFHGEGDQRTGRSLSLSVSMIVYRAPNVARSTSSNASGLQRTVRRPWSSAVKRFATNRHGDATGATDISEGF